jgi:hypothetical protein
MTQRPPDPLPEPGVVLSDGTVLPGQEALDAWHYAYFEHRKRLDAEKRRYRAECARLRELFGPPVPPCTRDAAEVTYAQDTLYG